jgi:hypothetical protein
MDVVTLPEQAPQFVALAPATDAAGRTSPFFSLKSSAKAFLWFSIAQANAAQVTVDVLQATNVAGAGSKVLAGTCRIWSCADATADPRMLRQADALTFVTSVALANKFICVEVDPPVNMDIAGGFDCLALRTSASNVANVTSGTLQMAAPRLAQSVPLNPRLD